MVGGNELPDVQPCMGWTEGLRQRFPNFLGCGPLLLLNIFRGPPGGLANTKDI